MEKLLEWPEGTKIKKHRKGPEEIELPKDENGRRGVNMNEFSRQQLRARKDKADAELEKIQPAQSGKTEFNIESYKAKQERLGYSYYQPSRQDEIKKRRAGGREIKKITRDAEKWDQEFFSDAV